MAKFQLSTDILKGVLSVAEKLATKETLPVLKTVCVGSEGLKLRIAATNLEVSMIVEVKGENLNRCGRVIGCPSMKTLKEILQTAGSEPKEVSFVSEIANTESEGIGLEMDGKFDVGGSAAKEFPTIYTTYFSYDSSLRELPRTKRAKDRGMSIQDYDDEFVVKMTSNVFDDVVRRVLPFSAKGNLRPVLGSVYYRKDKKQFRAVATDSYRLSELTFAKDEFMVDGEFRNVLLPIKFHETISSVFSSLGRPENIEILFLVKKKKDEVVDGRGNKKKVVTESVIQCTAKIICSDRVTVYVASRIVEGKFPAYEQIIPKESQKVARFSVNAKTLASNVDRAHIFAKEYNNSMILTLHKGTVHVDTRKTTLGKFSSSFAPIKNDARSNSCNLSTLYLREILNCLRSQDLEIEIVDDFHPVILFQSDESKKRFFHLLMPLRPWEDIDLPKHVLEATSSAS